MKILRRIAISFSLYSRIPVPYFEWKEADLKYSLMFFPWVGAIIGGISVGLYYIACRFSTPFVVTLMILGMVPLIVTGGFHLDGFMDVTDAVSSYGDMSKKLEILKDPHIGAFAVIGLIKYLMTYAIALGLLIAYGDSDAVWIYGGFFVISRCVSGITSLYFKKARTSGMLHGETDGTPASVKVGLIVELIAVIAIMAWLNWIITLTGLVMLAGWTLFYRKWSYRTFGGVTGDTAGYFVTVCECLTTYGIVIGMLIRG